MDLWEWTCPFCETLSYQHWRKLFANLQGDEHTLLDDCKRCECGACKQVSWWIEGTLVWPRVSSVLPPHDEMPSDVKALYDEARSVAEVSPRSAAALLRSALETLTR